MVILNLGAPLDYHLIFRRRTVLPFILRRARVGKYAGAYFGAAVTHAPKTVKKFLGFTLLPHSGVSLVFTGIAVSVLSGPAPECASIIQGTIAAAAVINEIIAVFMAKKGLEWAGNCRRRQKKPRPAGGLNGRPRPFHQRGPAGLVRDRRFCYNKSRHLHGGWPGVLH